MSTSVSTMVACKLLLMLSFLWWVGHLPTVDSQAYHVFAYPKQGTSTYPQITYNWVRQVTKQGKFTNRNAHATCVFKGKIWVVGGRSQVYNKYNLLPTYRLSDVWSSVDGANWKQELNLQGDFFAQQTDVPQPGPLAPWFERFGHTLDAIDSSGKGGYHPPNHDLMVMTGGFSPEPSNDVWVTADGTTWSYVDLPPPWPARAMHQSAVYQGKLYIMGGSPLTNDVWMLNKIRKTDRKLTGFDPLTRAMYMPYTYVLGWVSLGTAPWNPRVAFGLVSQWYFNESTTTVDQAVERLVLVGGYGGLAADNANYTGIHCFSDVWQYINSTNANISGWTLLTSSGGFGDRAFFTLNTLHATDARYNLVQTVNTTSPRMYMFGGGILGTSTLMSAKNLTINGYSDAWWSRDGINWYQINFESGGDYFYGRSYQSLYSSQEWSKTIVNSQTVYLGLWGHTMVNFNTSTYQEQPGALFLIAGDFDGVGSLSNDVYQSDTGVFCDYLGVPCNNQAQCGNNTQGCLPCQNGYTGGSVALSCPLSIVFLILFLRQGMCVRLPRPPSSWRRGCAPMRACGSLPPSLSWPSPRNWHSRRS